MVVMPNSPETLTKEESCIISTLLYFQVFHYPITKDECYLYLNHSLSYNSYEAALEKLIAKAQVSKLDNYLGITIDQAQVTRRENGNKMATGKMPKAFKIGYWISKFPFVRAVCISGSMSKGYLDEEGDLDYFVITQPGRLWVARTFLILYKKLVLLNSRKHFCLNYFIDTQHLQIPDKNIFTATELLTLKPVFGKEVYKNFIEENNWAKAVLPHKPFEIFESNEPKGYAVKKVLERALSGFLGEKLDLFFMRITLLKWKRKFGYMDHAQFDLSLRTRRYVSKHHPRSFQNRVLDKLVVLKDTFEKDKGVKLQE